MVLRAMVCSTPAEPTLSQDTHCAAGYHLLSGFLPLSLGPALSTQNLELIVTLIESLQQSPCWHSLVSVAKVGKSLIPQETQEIPEGMHLCLRGSLVNISSRH